MPQDDRVTKATPWLPVSTRGQIIELLRRSSLTVAELAAALKVSENAVRAHLSALGRDQLVEHRAMRPTGRKPARAYGLGPAAEPLFGKPYGLVLRQLLDVLGQRLPAAQVEDALREVGRRLAADYRRPAGELSVRVNAAIAVINGLGGLMEVDRRNGGFHITGYSCPIALTVPGHPEVCVLLETLVAELIGAPVQQDCDRREPVRCSLTVMA